MALLGLLAVTAHAASNPKLLFLFADDLRADSVAASDNPSVTTPTVETLAP